MPASPLGYVLKSDALVENSFQGHAAPEEVKVEGGTVHFRWSSALKATGPLGSVAFKLAVKRLPNKCDGATHKVEFKNCTMHDVLGAGVLFTRQCKEVGKALERVSGVSRGSRFEAQGQ